MKKQILLLTLLLAVAASARLWSLAIGGVEEPFEVNAVTFRGERRYLTPQKVTAFLI